MGFAAATMTTTGITMADEGGESRQSATRDIVERTFLLTAGPVLSNAVTENASNVGGGLRVDATYVIAWGLGVQVGWDYLVHATECPVQDASCGAYLAQRQQLLTAGPSLHFFRYGYTRVGAGVGFAHYSIANGAYSRDMEGLIVNGALGARLPLADHLDLRAELRGHVFRADEGVMGSVGLGAALGAFW